MRRVVVFGGRGFIGSEIVKQLKGFDVFVADRGKSVGKIINADILIKESVDKAIKDNDIVINLVGLTPTRNPINITYEQIHVEGVKNLVDVCKKRNNCKLIHMSAMGANINGKTEYLRTKGLGEKIVLESGLKVNIFCPSIIFDNENELIEMMGRLSFSRFFPNIPAKVQPVYRKDIAKIFFLAAKGKIKEKRVEIGGPEVLSIFEMAKIVYSSIKRKCFPIPILFVKYIMIIARLLNIKGIGKDQITSLYLSNTTKSKQKYVKLTKFTEWTKSMRIK